MSNLKKLTPALVMLLCQVAAADNSYFIDGFHGGIYGHYPVEDYTQYIVDQLHKHPNWRINLEIEPETWDTVAAVTPEAYEALRREFAKGVQIEMCNPAYAQPYLYNVMGESIIRNFQYGIKKTLEHFPEAKFLTYSSEEPCFTSCLPMVLSQMGYKYASLKCPDTCWGGYVAPYGGQVVNWVSSDGSSLLTVPRYACEDLEPNSTWQTTAWINSDRYLNACREAGIENPVAMTIQDAGWRKGPWAGPNGNGSIYTLWTPYFTDVAAKSSDDNWHLTQDDIRVNLMWGSQVLQRIGRQVRKAELDMITAEKMTAIAAAMNRGYAVPQATIDEAWRQLMLAQHHDSWIVPYNGFKHYGNWANAIAEWTGYASGKADEIKAEVAHSNREGAGVRVYNTLGYRRTEPVKALAPKGTKAGAILQAIDSKGISTPCVCDGTHVMFIATAPALGYSDYVITEAEDNGLTKQICRAEADGNTAVLSNDKIFIKFDMANGGAITSIRRMDDPGHEYVDTGADQPFGTMRGNFPKLGGMRSSTESKATVKSAESTTMQSNLTIRGEIAGTPYEVTYTLTAGSDLIDCALRIFWTEDTPIMEDLRGVDDEKGNRRAFTDDRYKLAMYFPLKAENTRVFAGAPFDEFESHNDNTFFSRWSEIKNNLIFNWVDVTNADCSHGLALLSDHTTTYLHGEGCPLGLNVQYSGPGLWGRGYRIDGPSEIHYALLPHSAGHGYECVGKANDKFTEPLLTFNTSENGEMAGEASLCEILTEGAHLSSANVDEQGNIVIRVFNRQSDPRCRIKLPAGVNKVETTDLLGNSTGALEPSDGVVTLDVPYMAARTIRIK